MVKLLLDYGCNPSTPFPNSRECPLTLAAEKGYVELTQLLLSRSAYVEARTKKGCSPLYLACREGFKEIAIMLAKHGASTEVREEGGEGREGGRGREEGRQGVGGGEAGGGRRGKGGREEEGVVISLRK